MSGVDHEDERERTTDDVSKREGLHQNQSRFPGLGSARRRPAYRPSGVRHTRGMSVVLALVRNVGTRAVMRRENSLRGGSTKGER